jgi:hypothetical protein
MGIFFRKNFMLFVLPALLILCVSSAAKVSAYDLFKRSCQNSGHVVNGNNTVSPVCTKSNQTSSSNQNNNVVLTTINAISNIVALLAGVFAVIMIVIAGFTYTTAGGNAENLKSARSRIIYASVGLAVIALAWTITRFVTDKVL